MKKAIGLNKITPSVLVDLFMEAKEIGYHSWTDFLRTGNPQRQKSCASYSEVVDMAAFAEKGRSLFHIAEYKAVNENDTHKWEFFASVKVSSSSVYMQFAWAQVEPKLAKRLLEKYNIKIE